MFEKGISIQKAKELSNEEKKLLLDEIEQNARFREITYWGCSRAVFGALQQYLKVGDSEVFKAASPFAGGIARMREACGALIGGVMAIGTAFADADVEAGKVAMEQPKWVEAMVRSNKFCERFQEEFGCITCPDVQAVVTPPGSEIFDRFNTLKAFEGHDKCNNVTGPTARLAAEIILQPIELFSKEINAFLDDLKQARQEQREARLK